MNILFFIDKDISPFTGGIERLTINLATGLANNGHRCYLGFFQANPDAKSDVFSSKILIDRSVLTEQLRNFIAHNGINTCIINISSKKILSFFCAQLFRLSHEFNDLKVIYGFYNIPGYEMFGVPLKLGVYRIFHGQINSNTLNGMIVTCAKSVQIVGWIRNHIAKKLQWGTYSDEIVLLSERYIPLYHKFVKSKSLPSFSAIGNPLSYLNNIDANEIDAKEKIVIQVARFDDNFKRQTLALEIWKRIEDSGLFEDWRFLMIGYGQDEKYIKRKAKKLHLKNIEFLGQQNPKEYLKRASIYMMTSAFEGLPMIVLDAQQCGVVPIAFNGFASIYDIIESDENGCIVSEGDTKNYVEKLMWLMEHHIERKGMAIAGLETCKKFSSDFITAKWEQILTKGK